MAMKHREKHPRASNYVLLAGIGMLVESIIAWVFYAYVPDLIFKNGGQGAGTLMSAFGCGFNIISALLIGLLVAAAFVDRRDPEKSVYRPRRDRLDEPEVVDDLSRRAADRGPSSTNFREGPQ
jgi:hypothetical protein